MLIVSIGRIVLSQFLAILPNAYQFSTPIAHQMTQSKNKVDETISLLVPVH